MMFPFQYYFYCFHFHLYPTTVNKILMPLRTNEKSYQNPLVLDFSSQILFIIIIILDFYCSAHFLLTSTFCLFHDLKVLSEFGGA